VLRTCRQCQIPTFLVRTKTDQSIRNVRRDNGYASDGEDETYRYSSSFVRAEKEAREQYIRETRANVKDNLERATLLDQRLYLVSSSTLLKVVKGTPSANVIDESLLRRDVLTIQPKVKV
jgi:hypothetical protein